MTKFLETFTKNLTDVGGKVHAIHLTELGNTLSNIVGEEKKVISHIKTEEKYKLSNIWKNNNLTSTLNIFDPVKENKNNWKKKISTIDCSISMAISFIAFTGTVVLSSKFENSRLLSLLPKHHVIIGHQNQLVWEMKDFWLKFGNNIADMGSNLMFITGPSRTADIEKTIVKGAHGPAIFDVILIEE